MSKWLWAGASVCLGLALMGGRTEAANDSVVLVIGDFHGHLSPCGCVKPMSGGIRRMASAIDTHYVLGKTIVLHIGSLVDGKGRQDELKAEALAESMRAMRVDVLHLGASEASLGTGIIASIDRLSGGGRLLNGDLSEPPETGIKATVRKGPFLIGGSSADPGAIASQIGAGYHSTRATVQNLLDQAGAEGLLPILLYHGTKDETASLAKEFPKLAMIVYQSRSEPNREPKKVGSTWLVSPGESGKSIIKLTHRAGVFTSMSVISLGPEIKDQKAVSRIYASYLRRVDQENLLDRIPRSDSPPFSGNKVCGSCHQAALKVWKASLHAKALKTLEDDGHGRDPDCVGCHVVGLEFKNGFTSRASTPALTDVGCESCHGPGRAHSENPKMRMPRLEPLACMKCHNTNHSPGFNFAQYWEKIKH